MNSRQFLNRLSVRLTAGFLLAAVSGVALVAALAYQSSSTELSAFIRHMQGMGGMMGNIYAEAERDFLDNLGRTLWIAGLSGVALALVLGALFTRHIVAPLSKVANAARRVAKGDLDQKVKIHGSGELAELGESFNFMATSLSRDREIHHNMLADIAHELRTPLSVLQGNVEAMLDGVMPASTENLNTLHQETLLLARLVEDLRTLTLADAGQLKFQPVATDLSTLVLQVIDRFKGQLATKDIKVAVETSDNLSPVMIDPDRTAQIVRNLLTNAYQYTPEGGSIMVRLAPDAGSVSVSVVDAGVGISPEDLPHIFDRFYRVDKSRTRSTGGSGLGLAIVKQLAEAQGGRVRVESVPGKGSIFSFWVPYASP